MSQHSVFQAVIEPSLDRVPVIEVRHTEHHGGRDIVLSHMVRRNVFTEFDRRLSEIGRASCRERVYTKV